MDIPLGIDLSPDNFKNLEGLIQQVNPLVTGSYSGVF